MDEVAVSDAFFLSNTVSLTMLTEKIRPGDKAKVKRAMKAKRLTESEKTPALRKIDWSESNATPPVSQRPQAVSPTASTNRPMATPGPSYTQATTPAKRKPEIQLTPGSQPWKEDEDIFDAGLDDQILAADELYIILPTQVVGVQYYKGECILFLRGQFNDNIYASGLVGSGENVMLQREPTNQFDRNAIKVTNFNNAQVGHLPRGVSGRLAPMLDQCLVSVEGIMTEGNSKY